jgi:pimeloyl-ACP methyl ester carboxylesterase
MTHYPYFSSVDIQPKTPYDFARKRGVLSNHKDMTAAVQTQLVKGYTYIMPVKRIMGIDINYEDGGEGHPIVLIHGLTSTLRMWDEQMPALLSKYRVVRYDCRGHGETESPSDPSAYSQEIFIDDALGLLDGLGLEKVYLCGLSMGGNIALNLALRHPDRVEAMIVASTGAGSKKDDGTVDGFKIAADILGKGDLKRFTEAMMTSPLFEPFLKKRPDLVEVTKENLLSCNAMGLANTIRGVQLKRSSIMDLGEKLRDLNVPTLILVGDKDTACLEPAEFMNQHMPRSKLVVFSKTGHIVNRERPEDFTREVMDFLNGMESSEI